MSSFLSRVLSSTKPFSLNEDQFDQNTYWGRVKHFVNLTNPLNMLVTSKQLEESHEKVEHFKETGKNPQGVPNEEMWKAKGILQATFHPDTGEKILVPFRFSAFVPMNILIIGGMVGARTIPSTIFWQGINQTYNVCVNHANRNASNPVNNTELVTNYFAAVFSSVGTAVGLSEAVKRSALSAATKEKLLIGVPLLAVIAANICNIGLMRRAEMQHGIFIKDEEGKVMGKSPAAGRLAVATTVFSRIVLVIPGMLGPPLLIRYLDQTKSVGGLFKKRPFVRSAVNITTIAIMIQLSLPLAIGLFPQYASVPLSWLEPEFQDHKLSTGETATYAIYNKGL
mmetsp:Transcript_7658/g.28687  ORF Transcript_7658/g.28687 Transcript_7658/m.28687 type:complete len:339 (-) Transcript_7658:110-1126(-)